MLLVHCSLIIILGLGLGFFITYSLPTISTGLTLALGLGLGLGLYILRGVDFTSFVGVPKLACILKMGMNKVKYTFGISFQSLNIGKNVGISGLLAFSLCHRLIGHAVTMIDLMTRGS